MIVFAVPQRNLAAAVFPETGVPELPKASNTPLLTNPPLSSSVLQNSTPPTLPPNFQNLTQQQRQELAARIIAQRNMQVRAMYAQTTAQQNGALYNNNNSTNQGPMNAQPGFNTQTPNVAFNQSQPPVSYIPQPGTSSNVSAEMMQSFIQRNPDSTTGL